MTPSDYLKFRDDLGNSSGFQSFQNRMIEYSLGYKTTHALKFMKRSKYISAVENTTRTTKYL